MKEAVAGPSKEVIALKQENARLKKLVAEEALVIDRLRELNETLAKGKNDGRRMRPSNYLIVLLRVSEEIYFKASPFCQTDLKAAVFPART